MGTQAKPALRTDTSFREGDALPPRVHRLYVAILNIAQPGTTVFITRKTLSVRTGIPLSTLDLYLRKIQAAKPWLRFRHAGCRGIGIFYRPDARKPTKLPKNTKPPTPPLKDNTKNPINDPKGDADKCMHPPPTTTTHRPLKLPRRAKIMTRSEWERRTWMKLWRRKSYKDPSMKWAKRSGVDLVRIIGHFTWHAKVEFSTIKTAIKRWWNEFLYAGLPLPARGKALFQCLFVRLNAWIHKLTIKNVKKARPSPHPDLPTPQPAIQPTPAA